MDRPVAVIHQFSLPEINNTEIIGVFFRIFVKMQSEAQHIIKALLEAAARLKGL